MFVWVFNRIDAVLLSWCAILKRDNADTVLNVFWIMVGIFGMFRASHFRSTDVKALAVPIFESIDLVGHRPVFR